MADNCDVTNYLPVTQLSAIPQPRGTCNFYKDSEDAKHPHILFYMLYIIFMDLEHEKVKIQAAVADNRTATGR
jgi:hypothetical protein